MARDPGLGRSYAVARAEAERRKRKRTAAPPVRGENAAEKAVAAQAPTEARYTGVVRKAQKKIAQDYADDPVTGRIPKRPGGSRHAVAADTAYQQVLGYGAGAAATVPGPTSLPLAAFSAAVLSRDPVTQEQFRGGKQKLDAARVSGNKTDQLRAALDFSLMAGAIGGMGGPMKGAKPAPAVPTRPTGADALMESLPQAKRLRREQEKLYTGERAKRAAAAEQAMQQGGEAGYRAALAELKGELPKLKFGALENFDQEAADALYTHIQQAGLRTYERLNTQTALTVVLDGRVPTRGQIKLLEKTFGSDVATQIVESVPFWAKARDGGLSLINVPRSLMASADLSAPFRQGLVLGARHPKMFAKEFKPMMKAFASEDAYVNVMEEIAMRPTFKTMQDARLQLTDLEDVTTREEAFMSNLAERIPVAGQLVKASGRGYVAFLNKFRADAFDNYLRMADEQGLDIKDPQLLKSIASWVNHATGRGSIKGLEGAMAPLSAVLFSPRLLYSRVQLLNPVYYARLDPFVRKQALRGVAQLLGGISMTLWLAKMGGAQVGVDPRSSDFAKIKVGDTRVDISGGFPGYIVAYARLIKGETVSSTTGAVRELEGGFGKPSRWEIFGNFLENKAAPVAGTAIDWAKNQNFEGEPFDPIRDGSKLFLPLGGVNAYEGFKESPAAGAASLGLGTIGFGVQTYAWKPSKVATKEYKEALKDVETGLRRGEISKEAAARFRELAQSDYESDIRSKQLRSMGLKDDPDTRTGPLDRQLMIDDGIRNNDSLEKINEFLARTGYKPVTPEEYEDTEMDLLEIRALADG